MKLTIVVLLLAAVITVNTQKKNKLGPGFTAMKMSMAEIKSMMNSGIDEMLDEDTESGLQSDFDSMLNEIEPVSAYFNISYF